MRHLLIGVAALAALAISGPVGAQQPAAAPPGAAPAAPPSVMPSQMNRMPAGGRATSGQRTGPSAAGTTGPAASAPSAAPTPGASAGLHHTNRMPAGGRATSQRGKRGHHPSQTTSSRSAGDVANQLNQQELSQIQGGGSSPSQMNRMPAGGRAISGGSSR